MKKVSMFEVIALSITVASSTAVLFTPYFTAQIAGQSAWIAALAAGLLTCIPTAAAVGLMARFPGQSLIKALPQLLGGVLGKTLSVLYAGFFIFFAALSVWRIEAFTIRFLLPETPQVVIRALFLLAVGYAAMSGTVSLLRTNVYVLPLEILVPLLAVILPAARLDFSFLLPLFEEGIKPVLDGTILLLGWFCQVPIVIMMYQWLVTDSRRRGWSLKAVAGTLAVTATIGIGFIGILAAFGPSQTRTMFYPAFALVRIISVSTFLEHTEVIFVVVWVASIYLTTTFYIQSFAESISDTFNIKGGSAKLWIMMATVLALIAWPLFHQMSFFSLIAILKNVGSIVGVVFGGAIPILLFLRVLLFPPKNKSPEGQEEGQSTGGGVFGSKIKDQTDSN
jgi:spore germination protein KB